MKKIVFLSMIVLCACNVPLARNETDTVSPEEQSVELVTDSEPTATITVATNTPTISPTLPPTATPTPSAVEWFQEEVKISTFYLFESGEDSSNAATRNYAYTFAQSEARVIFGELNLEHPGPVKDLPFEMVAVFYDQNENVYGRVSFEDKITTGWTMTNWVIGYGWDDPGHWDVGTYRIDILVGEQVLASDTFEIILNTPTPTPKPGAVVNTNSLNIRSGPDTVYSTVGSASSGDQLEILGQAYDCAWLKIKTTTGIEGWVSSDLVSYELPCSQIPAAPVPPTPIPQPTAAPTNTAAPQGNTVSIKIINNTGGTVTLNLSGPASYSFNFPAGTHTIQVIPGTYTYTAWGCGSTMSGTQKLQKGYEWTFYCK